MARNEEKIESEGFRNQGMTRGAAKRQQEGTGKLKKKVVAIQLDEREQAALKWLGGVEAFKKLLAPTDLCLKCRSAASKEGTWQNSLCETCRADS